MRGLQLLLAVLLLGAPPLVTADVSGIPDSATWYFHADFDAMRAGKSSRSIYDWLNAEVFEEIRGEIGIDFDQEAQSLTAFSSSGAGPVILLDGKISQETTDKIMALAAADGELQTFRSAGKPYYFFDGNGGGPDTGDIDIDIESLEKEAYVSFALKDKIVITNTQGQMQEMLANNGRIVSPKADDNALFVIRADRSLIQAGLKTDQVNEDDDWDSKILRNTRQIAIMMADLGDKLGIEAQLIAVEPDVANSLGSIIRGLIGLQIFNDEMDPNIASVLQSTTVDVQGSSLRVSLAIDSDTVVSALEN